MNVVTYKTEKVKPNDDLYKILDAGLPKLKENDVVAIASKIISISQNNVVKNDGKVTKLDLIKQEADYYLPEEYVNYDIYMTIKNDLFTTSAGIDESNGNGYFILWPRDLQNTTNDIWEYLRKKHSVKNLGIVVTDSRVTPLRKGVIGMGLSWTGFVPLRDYVGKPDIYGHTLRVTKTNIVDGLAAAAVVNTGEGDEQTPLAVISEISNMEFVDRVPTAEEIKDMRISPKDDVFAGMINSVNWIKGENKKD